MWDLKTDNQNWEGFFDRAPLDRKNDLDTIKNIYKWPFDQKDGLGHDRKALLNGCFIKTHLIKKIDQTCFSEQRDLP